MTKFAIRLVVVVRNFLLLARSRLRSLLRRITSGESEQAEESSKKGKVIRDDVFEDLGQPWPTRIGRIMYRRKVTRYRIRRVDTLLEQGLINQEEATERKREILGES